MKLAGVQLLKYMNSSDLRGRSMKIYSQGSVEENFCCDEIFVSESGKDVIRGLHFQPFPYGQKKIITVLQGEIEGIILDLRKESDTYGEYMNLHIDEECGYSLYIPEYCAWGFHALADRNVLVYNISGEYKKEYDKGIFWNSIGFDWQVECPIVSERDLRLIHLKQYLEEV